jgi:hypothetical protein
MEYNHNYIYLENLFLIVYNWFCNCRKKHISQDFNQLLTEAVKSRDKDKILYCISKGAKNINECLKYSCEQGHFNIVDLLLEKGANPIVGLRYSKSPNITRLLYRYQQHSENIN